MVINNERVVPSELLLLFSSCGFWLLDELAAAEVPASVSSELPDGLFSTGSSVFESKLFFLGMLAGNC